ncbi:MAG TPA: T9SS type A sorting domain-containing protein [Ignavibacteriaceae bacterium]|nr:T9SS type A sorting domain-containing protein [Ignavibacteriaceae bacterium]
MKTNIHILITFFLLFFLPVTILSQIIPEPNSKSVSNFYDIKAINDNYWNSLNVDRGFVVKDGVKQKVPGWKQYKRWEYYWEQRINVKTGEFPTVTSSGEYEKYLASKNKLEKTSSFNENWTNLGTNSSTGGYAGIGRINCIAFHPTDANTFWVGSPSGGIWRTTDGGTNWTILNNSETVLGVSDIAVTSNYSTSNTLYIATGDRDVGSMWSMGGGQNGDNNSVGIYKSTNGGSSWTATGLTFNKSSGSLIYRLLIHPSNNNILLAATNSGIYKTTDGGANWVKKENNTQWIDMEFKPGSPATIYASSIYYANIYLCKSTDTGETWSFSIVVSSVTGRAELAVTPNNSNYVYMVVCDQNGGQDGVYKSTDSGTNWTKVNNNTSSNMLGYYSDGSGGGGGQGFYDLCIAASPTNANILYIGGINTWKSTDGGVNWAISNMWTSYFLYNKSGAPVVHCDKHTLAFRDGNTLFDGNDGGIYKTTNGGTSWIDLSNGLVISQIYRIGVSQTISSKVLTGLQDNGTKLFSGSWLDVYGGDGMECIVDFSNPSYMYVTYINGEIHRNTDGFATFNTTQISNNIPGGQPTGAWVTPYIIDPNSNTTLFAGYDKVWKTTDRGNTWTSASQILSSTDKLRSLAIAPSNSGVLYTADKFKLWKTTDGGMTNWTDISSYLPSNSDAITYIGVHNTDAGKLWICYGGYTDGAKIYESSNGGTSWTNISTGLPNLPVMCLIHYKTITSKTVLFAGTDLGVYVKDGSNNWAAYNTNLPNVVVTELDIYYPGTGTDKLRAGTYGRGLWETDINAPLPVELLSFTAEVAGDKVILNWTTATEINNFGFEVERLASGYSWEKIGFVAGSGNSNSAKEYSFTDDNISAASSVYRLKQIDNDGHFAYSHTVKTENLLPAEYILASNYPNPFNPATVISYQLPVNSLVRLELFSITGEKVATLVNEELEAGYHNYNLSASALGLSSGVYIYRMIAGEFVSTKKLMLIK